jgi:hypothetical protein
MDKPDLLRVRELNRLNETKALCDRVAQTLSTAGWKEIIEPLIDKSISDITGCKMANGRWHGGLLDKARKDERREYYIGYKQALVDLHRRVYGYVDAIKRLEDQRDELVKGAERGSRIPLIDDSRYSPREEV